jgi:serine/threonine protein kinase
MAARTRRTSALKQQQYRLTDDEDEQPSKKGTAGGILASLSTNVPAIKNRKVKSVKSSDNKNPPSSVVIAKTPPCFSPPTQAYCSSNESDTSGGDADRSIDDGISAISCDVFSPPSKTLPKSFTNNKSKEDASEDLEEDSQCDDRSVSLGTQDVEESEEESSDSEDDDDRTAEFEMNDVRVESEEDIEQEEPESEDDSYESLSEEDAYEPTLDDDEYDPYEEESGSEEELEFVEEEEEIKRHQKILQKEGKEEESKASSKLESKTNTPNFRDTNKVPLGTPSRSPVTMTKSPVRDYEDDDVETDIELTPAPKLSGKNFSMLSPEALVAVVVDEDDDTADDVLVATILHEDDSTGEETDVSMQEARGDDTVTLDEEDDEDEDFAPDFDANDQDDIAAELGTRNGNVKDDVGNFITMKFKENHGAAMGNNRNTKAEMPFKSADQTETKKESYGTPDLNRRPKQRKSKSRKSFYRQEGKVKRGKWTLGAKIGVGSFGVVHVGMNTQNGTLMAVKIFKVDGAVMKDVRREIELMRSLRHQNIVRYLGAQMDKTNLHIFQEWVPGGSVACMLSRFGAFPLQVVRSYVSQTLAGLEYLHENDIMHRDIKGSNILVNDEGIVKLADFGASKKMANLNANLMMSLTVRGTPYFMAPEVFEEKYSAKADIWGVGCVAYQMATASPPWKDRGFTNPISLFNHIQRNDGPPPMPESAIEMLSKEDTKVLELFESLVGKCFEKDPSMRPSASDLLEEPFFIEMHQEIDDESSHYPGLFSPGNETTSSWDATPNKNYHPTDFVNSLHRPADPSPKRLTRSKSEVQWKTTFLSPPLPKREGGRGSPSPLYKSPHQTISPKRDSSDWPVWARAQQDKQNLFGNSPKKQPSEQDLSGLMGSLALSEDSTTRNPFASTTQSKSSLAGSTANSHLIGLDLLEPSSDKYEI